MSDPAAEPPLVTGASGTRLLAIPHNAPLPQRVAALEEEAAKLALLLEMAGSLSSEKELDVLMNLIAGHASRIMDCERTSVFMVDHEKSELFALIAQGIEVKELRFSINSGIAGFVARNGVPLNIPDAYQDNRFNQSVDKATGYRTVSILCMPFQDRYGNTLGLIQCLNKRGANGKPTPFGKQDEIYLSAVAKQAAIFIENSELYRQMDRLFESFVEACSRSIDDRDPITSGHSRRVTLYSLNLARAVHESNEPPFDQIVYTRDRIRQLRYAGLLHDAGKIGVREHILYKASRLLPATMQAIRARFDCLREKLRADCLEHCLKEKADPQKVLAERHAPLCAELDQAWKFIEGLNTSNFLDDAGVKSVEALLQKGWITAEECKHLSVRRGNLTEDEWEDMRSHVTKSFRMLNQIPWPKKLHDIPEVAYTHHEKYDGSGYPRKLKGDAIHFDGQVMCVADIYDALTAQDRPYKKAMPHEVAQRILMEEEAAKGRIMPDLVKLFFAKNCYRIDKIDGSGVFSPVKG